MSLSFTQNGMNNGTHLKLRSATGLQLWIIAKNCMATNSHSMNMINYVQTDVPECGGVAQSLCHHMMANSQIYYIAMFTAKL